MLNLGPLSAKITPQDYASLPQISQASIATSKSQLASVANWYNARVPPGGQQVRFGKGESLSQARSQLTSAMIQHPALTSVDRNTQALQSLTASIEVFGSEIAPVVRWLTDRVSNVINGVDTGIAYARGQRLPGMTNAQWKAISKLPYSSRVMAEAQWVASHPNTFMESSFGTGSSSGTPSGLTPSQWASAASAGTSGGTTAPSSSAPPQTPHGPLEITITPSSIAKVAESLGKEISRIFQSPSPHRGQG
jgi:hypothetical protein